MEARLDPRFFPLILDAISQGIFTIDSDCLVTSFNRAAERITGYRAEEVIGKSCFSIFKTELCQLNCPLKRSIDTGRSKEDQEVTITTKDGNPLLVAISTAALLDERDRVIGGVEMFRDLHQVALLRRRLADKYVLEDVVSKNHRMRRILDMLPLLARSNSTILIEGESGTGKEIIARAIHNLSPRADKPFVAINCGAIPENLIESELFGYEKGAFTDAKKDKPGRLALAEGGTLLLDEVGELSRPMQVKLLRVLQEREYEPLGATCTRQADIRVIAATNRDLSEQVRKRRFRQDLYYRLNVVHLPLPPLRERKEDIPLLVRHFIERFNHLQGRRIRGCSERVLAALMHHDYPGNIRELENAVEHAFVVCTANIIQADDLPEYFFANPGNRLAESRPLPTAVNPLQVAEAAAIRDALEKCDYKRSQACQLLGMSRNTLWRKMKKYHIEAPRR